MGYYKNYSQKRKRRHAYRKKTINSEEKKKQERNSLKRIDDSFKKIIIVKDNIVPRYDEYGIYYIGIKEFLLMDDFLEA